MGQMFALTTWALVLAGAVPLARRWAEPSGRLVALGVFAFGGMVFAFQLPGIVAAVTGVGVVGAATACLAAGALCIAAWMHDVSTRRRRVDEGIHRAKPDPATLRRLLPVWVLSGLAVAAFFAVAVSSALSAPPRGWDVLTYHLPKAVSWLQNGDLGTYGSTGAFYPGNAEILLFSILSTGRDVLAPLVQMPFALLGGAGVYGIARELGARRGSAAAAATIFLMAPMVFFQSTVAKDDLVVTAVVLAGAYFLLSALRASSGSAVRRNVAAAGFALGLALGTKYSILPFVVASVPIAYFALSLGREGERRWVASAGYVIIFAVCVLVPSTFWFVRNLAVTGNPVAPLTLAPSAWIGASGLDQQFQFVPELSSWWIFPWMDKHLKTSYSGSAGFGAAFAVFFLPGLAAAVAHARTRRTFGRVLTLLALIALGVLGWWFGKHHLPRFLLPLMGLACAPIALLFDTASRRARAILALAAVLALAFSAAETLRIVLRDDDITWSHRGGIGHSEFYSMPEFIHELPAGTTILLLSPTEHDYHQTFRYPLVGRLPGKRVLMEGDVGFVLDRRRADLVNRGLRSAGVKYVFLRTIGLKPFTTWFDDNAADYRKVYDELGWSYPWYRESFAYTATGEYLGPGTVVTKIYEVLPD